MLKPELPVCRAKRSIGRKLLLSAMRVATSPDRSTRLLAQERLNLQMRVLRTTGYPEGSIRRFPKGVRIVPTQEEIKAYLAEVRAQTRRLDEHFNRQIREQRARAYKFWKHINE